jgi:chromosome segregation ATPase
MLEERQETTQVQEGSPRWLGIAVVALAAVSLLGVGMAWSASNHVRDAQQSAANDNKTLRQNLDVLNQRIAQEESANTQLQGDLTVVTDRMKITQGELATARKTAEKIRQDDAKQLADAQQALNGELATKASTDDVKAVSTGVDGVKSDLDSANQKWSAANGELGTQIARTHDEIDQLRRLGQRDYYEFTLNSKGGKQRVGNVTMELRGTNTKRNQYTVALYVDDMRLEKSNRAVNEPIFFYTKGSRSSLELVVNSVGKDKIVGYLSAPKVQTASAAAPSGN